MTKAIGFEAQLLRWNVSSSGGTTITLQLSDEDDLEPFKLMTMKSGKQAGQRLMVAVSKITDDEKEEALPKKAEEKAYMMPDGSLIPAPVDATTGHRMTPRHNPLPQGLCGLAVRWCEDVNFQNWLWGQFPADQVADIPRKEWCKLMMQTYCEIDSRKDLDLDPAAADKFRHIFKNPYQEYLEKTNG